MQNTAKTKRWGTPANQAADSSTLSIACVCRGVNPRHFRSAGLWGAAGGCTEIAGIVRELSAFSLLVGRENPDFDVTCPEALLSHQTTSTTITVMSSCCAADAGCH